MLRVIFPLALALSLALGDDRAALVDFYDAAGGGNWTNAGGWGSSADMCTWCVNSSSYPSPTNHKRILPRCSLFLTLQCRFGVQCDHDGSGTHVTSISLASNNMVGTVSPSVGELEGLKLLDLSSNELGGDLPAFFDRLSALQYLRLNNNQFTGGLPTSFQNFSVTYPNLAEIQLQYNQLSGGIPESMFGPVTEPPFSPEHVLKVLDVSYNKLTGALPTRMARETRLVSFLVAGNALTGTVDKDTGALLAQIKYCDMTGIKFDCPMPAGVQTNCKAVCK